MAVPDLTMYSLSSFGGVMQVSGACSLLTRAGKLSMNIYNQQNTDKEGQYVNILRTPGPSSTFNE